LVADREEKYLVPWSMELEGSFTFISH
jgi:hypothetical protein